MTLPEVRSTSVAVESFVETAGAALAPLITGLIAVRASLRTALVVCTSAWAAGALALISAITLVPRDIESVRTELRQRAQSERQL